MTADEATKANVAAMGDRLGHVYSALWQSVALIHAYWADYVELFGTSPKRVQMLNRTAPAFFRMLQDELWDISLLHLARLTDPAKSQGSRERANLTVQALPSLTSDETLKTTLEELVREAIEQTRFCRDWRNRRIAHSDLKLALGGPTTPLATGSRAQVKDALGAIADVLNAVSSHYLVSETHFDGGGRVGDARSMLDVLDMGTREQDARRKRLAEGQPLKSDFERREW